MIHKNYNSHDIEATWRQRWEQNGDFKPRQQGEPYCIVLPPPNVTGSLHMGHGFQVTLMDALIRYQRMCGKNVLWQGGTDHAGIATQMVVERQLLAQGKTRHDLGREAFLSAVWEWKATSGQTITQQLRRLGASIDWSRERFTCDPEFSVAVEKVFIDLYEKGLIYRGQRLVNWDPQLLTAVSDLEVINQEEQGHLWTLRYPLIGHPETFLQVATTRPETLFGDVAIAVHPEDTRYQHLIGTQVQIPLTDRCIPIITDESVDPNFGSGCVKITPAHDFNDYAVAQRHQLPCLTIFTPAAHLNEQAPSTYQGLERFTARKKVLEDLERLHLIEKIEAHTLNIPRGDRSGVVIEPYLTDQWFMSMKPLAEPALQAIAEGKLEFIPETWRKVCVQWLENIEDWCVSRQLWWGHRIPAWYDHQGHIYVGKSEAAVRARHGLKPSIVLTQDEDVLDTWFSSALWPFASLGWPESTYEFTTFYPTNVLVTGFDIIFFWVARMLMLGLHYTGQVPFSQVYVTGLIRDHEGQKMSKSKGNVLDPLDVIQGISLDALTEKRCQGLMQPQMAKKIAQATRKQFPKGIQALGTDALRFTYCALASPTRDIRFDLSRTEGYRNFCNKLWNAARFVLMQVGEQPLPLPEVTSLTLTINRAFRSCLAATISAMHQHFAQYRFDWLAQTIYEFIWNEYCDWYLELAKPMLNETIPASERAETRYHLVLVLECCLRLLHPLMPFITEEIWQSIAPLLGKQGQSILSQAYPTVTAHDHDPEAEAALAWIKAVVGSVRTLRSEMNLAPGRQIPLRLAKGTTLDRERFTQFAEILKPVARLSTFDYIDPIDTEACTISLVGDLELRIPMAGLIDTTLEIPRLQKEIAQLDHEIARATQQLANTDFVQKAPSTVVAQLEQRLAERRAHYTKLKAQLAHLSAS